MQQAASSVRQVLAQATRDIHETLHGDPVLSVLTSPRIQPAEYHAALHVLGGFLCAVEGERLRHNRYADFTLAPACAAVRSDLRDPLDDLAPLDLPTDAALLGALYVAHGAAFGRNSFRNTVTTALPTMRHAFLTLRTPRGQWQNLVSTLEATGADAAARDDLLTGAQRAFACVHHLCALKQPRPQLA